MPASINAIQKQNNRFTAPGANIMDFRKEAMLVPGNYSSSNNSKALALIFPIPAASAIEVTAMVMLLKAGYYIPIKGMFLPLK